MPCVQFTTLESGIINAEVTIHKPDQDPDIVQFNLIDTCHRALIQTLGSIWPDWIDYDLYMDAKYRESI